MFVDLINFGAGGEWLEKLRRRQKQQQQDSGFNEFEESEHPRSWQRESSLAELTPTQSRRTLTTAKKMRTRAS